MFWTEFEELAGYKVRFSDYADIIEPMYMALPNVSKQEFVKMLDKKRFALRSEQTIIKEIKKLACELRETCDHYTDFEKKDRIEECLKELAEVNPSTNYMIMTATTLPGYRGCSFPSRLCLYSHDWNTCYKEIVLALPWYEEK